MVTGIIRHFYQVWLKMPIVIKDFSWKETENMITVRVPFGNVLVESKMDLITTPEYIKASYEKYFFEMFPFEEIDSDSSRCTINENEIYYELAKTTPKLWNVLEKDLNKSKKMEIKKDALANYANKLQKIKEEKSLKLHELKRCAVTEAVSIDTEKRNLIDKIKNDLKSSELHDLKSWKSKKVYKNLPAIQNEQVPIPLPRTSQSVDISFTPRALPTPSRESRLQEEEEWLEKQSAARRSAGFSSEDLREEEKNPDYLLSKGNEFLKVGNYLGAISAYSFGLKISPNYAELYVKKSEAQYLLGNYNNTVKDCSSALELMKPEVEANLVQRALCIGRRGVALDKLGLRRQAIEELKAALRLKPELKEFDQYLWEILQEEKSDAK